MYCTREADLASRGIRNTQRIPNWTYCQFELEGASCASDTRACVTVKNYNGGYVVYTPEDGNRVHFESGFLWAYGTNMEDQTRYNIHIVQAWDDRLRIINADEITYNPTIYNFRPDAIAAVKRNRRLQTEHTDAYCKQQTELDRLKYNHSR